MEDRRRVQGEFGIGQLLLYWDSRSLDAASVVCSGLLLSNIEHNDSKCKKTLHQIFENYLHLEIK